ncbi:hypothetical protein [Larsenimonas rhizosphaerae]|uniref:hypothetical protein n=1 Tax=Larsenimonas rhizosphaerae TaxID=2944682 RepID=UPI00203355DE|nr:hypothetical protein [Larsenimonas rhizosphaerae]
MTIKDSGESHATGEPSRLARLELQLDDAVDRLADAPSVSRVGRAGRVFDIARRVLMEPGGCGTLEARARAMEEAGIFEGSDWARPGILLPTLTRHSLTSPEPMTVVIEALSELRLLAVAREDYAHPQVSSEQARSYLTQVLALNLSMLFGPPSEAERETQGKLALVSRQLLAHLSERIGFENVIDSMIDEIWRLLKQRPIQTETIREMITRIALCQADPEIDLGTSGQGATRLVSSLFGPTQACSEDPGIDIYEERLAMMDGAALQLEATGMARAMHDTGLVSAYHAVLVRYLLKDHDHLISEALGLSATGRDCLLRFHPLIRALLARVAQPETDQALYGLARLLERGILYQPPIPPALWRQLGLPLSDWSRARIKAAYGDMVDPEARLLEGVLCMLGQPLGVGQGNNPTCQSARALSMWGWSDPDYLLQMVTWAARDDGITMHFEGQPISSCDSGEGLSPTLPLDLDPVSLLVVPHLDRIYMEMGRRCIGREGDPHRWINPEFHGWWTGRAFHINVDVATGMLIEPETFLRHFYAAYHPHYNGDQPLIHPQPAGIAVTDSAARFIGWHAISILRAAPGPDDHMRIYFFNPNNDSGQNWGDGVDVSTDGCGERFGEASLPFAQFASRLYIFHQDPQEEGRLADIPAAELDDVMGYIRRSWGAERLPPA